ncbi:MAG: tetratricopeptide (TPR) repeat protein [Myxococcota bacterium]|jgi:tetratricopeptide (TPR) repeat protein
MVDTSLIVPARYPYLSTRVTPLSGHGVITPPLDPAVPLRRSAQRALQRRDWAAARAALDHLRVEAPGDWVGRVLEFELAFWDGAADEARSHGRRLVELRPGSPRVQYWMGRLCYRDRRYDEAAAHFREGLALHPNVTTRLWLGKALTQHGVLDEAERILVEISVTLPHALRDLAWLHERRGDPDTARKTLKRFLKLQPDDDFAKRSLERLEAEGLSADELIEEVAARRDLGDDIEDDLLAPYIKTLLRRGDIAAARVELQKELPGRPPRVAHGVGWECHKGGAPDLAFDAWVAGFEQSIRNIKTLNSLEADARKVNRIGELIALYEAHAPDHKPLFGRLHKLRRALNAERG